MPYLQCIQRIPAAVRRDGCVTALIPWHGRPHEAVVEYVIQRGHVNEQDDVRRDVDGGGHGTKNGVNHRSQQRLDYNGDKCAGGGPKHFQARQRMERDGERKINKPDVQSCPSSIFPTLYFI
ncbi:hypothetical protein Vretimale_6731 [Volvox reticuliferus]|uniref:Uncharacterized protein n=1 Tax=Volvox reticuliferus TaxID=1737510 RepID=A0A8J4G8F8_9CHLO|nr:hypothetical protein Vretimale_6731 [Volvox reticuliferus]